MNPAESSTLHFPARALVALCLVTTVGCAAFAGDAPVSLTETPVAAVSPAETLEQKWGVQVSGLFLSGSGNLVDLRYRVLDPAKAAPLTKPENKPLLTNQSNGAKLHVPDTPTVGQLRQTGRPPVAGKVCFILFANTQHHVKRGDKVTVAVGDFKVENLTVE